MSRSYHRFGLITNGVAAILCGASFVSLLLVEESTNRSLCMPLALCFLANALLASQHFRCLHERTR